MTLDLTLESRGTLMTTLDRIAELERELSETRYAAARMILGMADAIATSPEGRADLARGSDDAAAQADPVTAPAGADGS